MTFRPADAPSPFGFANKLERVAFRLAWLALARWTPPQLHGWRALVLRAFGARIGSGTRVYSSVRVWLPRNLDIGDGSLIGPGVELYNQGLVTIGSHCVISQRAVLCASTHRVNDPAFTLETRPIRLENECWVAAEAFVGPGVTMGQGSVLGARAALFADTTSMTIHRGNPASQIGVRTWNDKRG